MSVLLSEHLSLLASAQDGIQKLRGIILELAVRGKLVPQDPNDEPASELLKRIAKERERLEAEGTCKKTKPLPSVVVDEQIFVAPNGWEWCRLHNVFDVRDGTHDSPKFLPDGVPFLTSKNIYGGKLDLSDLKFISESDHVNFSRRSKVDRDDVLFAMIGSIGNPVIVNTDLDFSFKNMALFKYFSKALSSPQFLQVFLSVIAADVKVKAAGGVQSFVALGTIRSQPIALPPLAEQHRIVAKVDELMALCDRLEAEQTDAESAHAKLVETLLGTLTQSRDADELAANWRRLSQHFDTLFSTETSLDSLKQTILQLAVMGKLVPQDAQDEPASELLKRISAEKTRLVAEGNIRKDKLLPAIGDEEKPYKLPHSWLWVRFEVIASTRLGKMLDKAKNKGELKPYLRNTNVQWWKFELEDVKTLRLEQNELDEFRLSDGDLLICEGGEPGRCAIWGNETEEMYFQKAIHRARPCGGVLPEYLQVVLRQDAVSGNLERYFTGATIKHFPGDKLSIYVLPLPPVTEQHRIVTKVDELMALCERLKADLAESRTRQARLSATLIESALQAA